MSTFKVEVVLIDDVSPIDGADAIEVATIGGYQSVVRKGQFTKGSPAVYIPEAAVVPEWLLEKMGLVGRLAGKEKNRVKAIKLRKVLSQGLLYPVEVIECSEGSTRLFRLFVEIRNDHSQICSDPLLIEVKIGDDLAEQFGIFKYEPPIPVSMSGQVCNIGSHNTIRYDIENFKKFPNVFNEFEVIYATEKVHGTCCQIGIIPGLNHPELIDGDIFVGSKGLSGQGLVFKNVEDNAGNLYMRAVKQPNGEDRPVYSRIKDLKLNEELRPTWLLDANEPIYVFGEVFGAGVQDLHYGFKNVQYRIFDVYYGTPGKGRFLNLGELEYFCQAIEIPMVPVLFYGEYNKETLDALKDGKTVVGNEVHIREGIVIKPMFERRDDNLGRVIVKHVSEAYLLRQGGSEFN